MFNRVLYDSMPTLPYARSRAKIRMLENDKVDIAMAHFLNNYTDRHRLKIPFVYISEGLYQFGQIIIFVAN